MKHLAEMMSQIRHDLRYSFRSLCSSPGFALAAMLTIALGVGINSGMYSLLSAVAFDQVPAASPGRLIAVNQEVRGVGRGRNNFAQFSTSEYRFVRDQATTVSGLLAYGRMWTTTLGGETPRQIVATPVSCNFFDVLGVPVILGRALNAADCENGADARVAVITNALWQSRFGADAAAIGRTLTVNGNELQIVGVAPEGFSGIDVDRPSLFLPLAAQRLIRPDRNYLDDDNIAWLNVVGRLAPGATAAQAQAELSVIAAQLDLERPGRQSVVSVVRATRISSPDMRSGVIGAWAVAMAAFGLVLLVACTNVANLMLARADTKIRETAIRLSLGATRARLIRCMLIESVSISIVGGLVGAYLAAVGMRVLVAVTFATLPAEAAQLLQVEPEFDVRVFAFALTISVVAGILFGLAPALTATRPGLRSMIDSESAIAGNVSRGRLQRILVGVQVGFSMVLVVATALLIRGFDEVRTVNPQFDHDRLVVAGMDLPAFGYDTAEAVEVQRQGLERVRSLPGVDDVALALLAPLEPRNRSMTFRLPEESESRVLQINTVSSNFFSVTGIPIVRGRSFTSAETDAERSSAVILSESTAKALWPNADPIGETLIFQAFEESLVEVVGIARDTEVSRIGETDTQYVYLPAVAFARAESQLIVRSSVPAQVLADGIEAVYADLAPQLAVSVRPLAENFAYWRSISGIATALSGGLAALGLVLASIGIFGVIATVVGRRIREIGVRIALGAGRRDVLQLVLDKSLRPALIGAAIGALACLLVGRVLSSLLFGVSPSDPIALAGACLAVLGAAVLASIVPARRALNVDPMTALRYE